MRLCIMISMSGVSGHIEASATAQPLDSLKKEISRTGLGMYNKSSL